MGKAMDTNVLKAVVTQIHRRFPEFAGVQPKVRKQDAPQPKSLLAPQTYLLTFHSLARAETSTGSKSIPRWVRVVINEQGKILKVTTSR
jgi:hypothetical protein